MRKSRIFINIAKYNFAVLLLLALWVCALCFPQLYYFDHKLHYKQFTVYSDKPFPNEIYAILDKANALIQKSEIYDPEVPLKIFIRSNYFIHDLMPWQFTRAPFAVTRPIVKNIFISKADMKSDLSYSGTGRTRTLHTIIAHEATHVLVDSNFMFDRAKFKSDWSDTGFLWKEEGYAEYIAGGSVIGLEKGIKILIHKEKTETNIYELDYFKYWIAVTYLIEKKHMNIREILASELLLDNVLEQALANQTTRYS